MLSRSLLNRAIILAFLVLVGFCLAKAIYHKSIIGIVLALVSLAASIWFLWLVVKAKEHIQARERG